MHRVFSLAASFIAGASALVMFLAAADVTLVQATREVAAMKQDAQQNRTPVEAARATVHELSNGSKDGWCSAVAIAPDRAMTAAHCAEGKQGGAVFLEKDGKFLPVTEWSIVEGVDLAYIMVPGLTGPYADVAPSVALESFMDVLVLGYPQGGELTETYGYFVGWMLIEDEDLLGVTAPVKGGNSGGGAFLLGSDGKPYLFGIVVSSLNDGRMTFAVDVTTE